MLSSSKLVLQAQLMISDSEDSKGYLSEGEQYRRSRFPLPYRYSNSQKSPKCINNPKKHRLVQEYEQTNQNSAPPVFNDAISKKRPGKLYYNTTIENKYDTTSESELSDFEKACPFSLSTNRQDYSRKNVIRKSYENRPNRKGDFKLPHYMK